MADQAQNLNLPPPEQLKMQQAFSLVGTPVDDPEYDANIKRAEQLFNGLLKGSHSNHMAWLGMFLCALRNTEKTFLNTEKIGESLYWLKDGYDPNGYIFQVESYFCRSVVRGGKPRNVLLDDILQPGRKAKLYLNRALECAPEGEQQAIEELLENYFSKPFEDMPVLGLEEIQRRAAEK